MKAEQNIIVLIHVLFTFKNLIKTALIVLKK